MLCLISMIHSVTLLLCLQSSCLFVRINENRFVDGCLLCIFLSSLPRLSSVSVVFDFNDSLNDVAPVSPMSLSVHVNRIGKE